MQPHDELLNWVWPRVEAECGMGVDPKEFLANLPISDFLLRKSPRVSWTRWGTWADADEAKKDQRAKQLLILLHFGIVQGWFSSEKRLQAMMGALAPKRRDVQAVDGARTTAQAKAAHAKLRDKCANTMHLAAMVLADDSIRKDEGMIAFVCRLVREETLRWASRLRGVEGVSRFHFERAALVDGYSAAILGLLEPPTRLPDLMRCGLSVAFDTQELKGLKADSVEVLHGQQTMQDFNPHKFALVLGGTEELERRAMLEFKKDYEAFLACQVASDEAPFWKKLLVRSVFQHVVVSETLAACAPDFGPEHIPMMKAQAKRICCHLGTTLPVEVNFRGCQDTHTHTCA